ncbi:MAG TPA: hypothetical protein VEH76_06945 [Methylocystis sp.]|nr:hypothetical protein [Methylocystis sp.]
MTAIALIIGLAAAFLLLTAGYLYGVKRGVAARESLRAQTTQLAREIEVLREDSLRLSDERQQSLRLTIEKALSPIVKREQLSLDLSQLKAGAGERRDLTFLLDRIAEAGNFSTVVLSDADGLPLAANAAADHPERLAVSASMMLLMSDRVSGDDQPRPLSIMIQDEANRVTLCRVFEVQGQRVTLTAVAAGDGRLSPTALDPALVKVSGMLANAA